MLAPLVLGFRSTVVECEKVSLEFLVEGFLLGGSGTGYVVVGTDRPAARSNMVITHRHRVSGLLLGYFREHNLLPQTLSGHICEVRTAQTFGKFNSHFSKTHTPLETLS